MGMTLPIDQPTLKEIWTYGGTQPKAPFIHSFARSCIANGAWADILYLVKIIEDKSASTDEKAEIFYALRRGNLANPLMSWPYLSLASEGSLAYMRLVVPKLHIWDFRTGKKLSR